MCIKQFEINKTKMSELKDKIIFLVFQHVVYHTSETELILCPYSITVISCTLENTTKVEKKKDLDINIW